MKVQRAIACYGKIKYDIINDSNIGILVEEHPDGELIYRYTSTLTLLREVTDKHKLEAQEAIHEFLEGGNLLGL